MAGRKTLPLCFGIILQVLLATAAQDQMTSFCANDGTPACAQSRNNGMYLLFDNECDLRKAQRGNLMNGPLYDVSLRFCFPNCEFQCSPRYQPVCGINSRSGERKTFRSRCEMVRTSCLSRTDWLVHRWGVCPKANTITQSSEKTPVPVPCTRIYRPVCAMYAGVKSTFSNECLVNAENIKTQRNWRIVSEGLCGEDSTKMKHSRKQKPKAKPKSEAERTKRSHKGRGSSTQAEDFQIPEDAVEIYAPSTFHTQFISHTGAVEKSYSLPARKPYVVPLKPKMGKGLENVNSHVKSCVFGNETICGSFRGQSRTFSSVCELMDYSQKVGNAWTISYNGACRRCDKPCPTAYQPICATRDGIYNTIVNECYLERVRCKEPNSTWKFSHKGECPKTSGQATRKMSTDRSRPLSLVPRVLFGRSNSTTIAPQYRFRKPSLRTTTTKAPTTPSRQHQLMKRMFKAPLPSLETNSRKIRKTELVTAGFGGFGVSGDSNRVSADEDASWSVNDNWLVRKTLDNVKFFLGKKPTSFKKTHSEKSPLYYLTVPPKHTSTTTTSTTSTSTTTTAPPPPRLPAILSTASKELLNLDFGNTASAYEDVERELLLMLTTKEATTTSSTTPVPSTTQPPKTTDSSTTELLTSSDSASFISETANEDSTTDFGESTDPPTTDIASSTTAAPPFSTTEAEELNSQTTGSDVATTEASSELPSTTLNADYTADESFSESSGQTSIYGLDKNSLIMRLLRARSNQNVVI
ncbi:mucin-5AC [Drosophila ficusphila]|uniref:mucin-5AC n=1 Tax=Drosophila ficusphila TaxID=30025 RepID=UPI0007E60809|nr:mucin-5AC [Drosophila ficusphila]